MKQLYAKQKNSLNFFVNNLRSGSNTLDASEVGTGKTVVAAHIAAQLKRPVGVLCPKAVVPSWQRELAESGVEPLFVLNYEKIRTGGTQWMKKIGKLSMRWNLPPDTLMLMDEIHKCKGPYTQNAQLLISLVSQGVLVHGMSATAAEDPTEMRGLGYMLKLHGLNKPGGVSLRTWYGWMMINGCFQDQWNKWTFNGSPTKLEGVHRSMFGVRAARLTAADFPESFRENRVFVEPVNFTSLAKINKAYESLGITPAIVTEFIENGTVTDNDNTLVDILRARQLAESFKIPDIGEMALDLIEQGHNVVVFVNFRDSVDALGAHLGCPVIQGGQSPDERQGIIDAFQRDEIHCVVVNIAAGGTGISLHDLKGNRPRVSLVSPTFDAKSHLQALGRIHRNGAKSDAVQKILVAAGTVEEAVMKAIDRKIKNIKNLHGDNSPKPFNHSQN